MLLTAYASGSAGNCYEVNDGETAVLLECGLSPKRLRKLCPRPLTGYAGCLITHEHKDHCAGAQYLTERGVDVYASAGTLNAIGLTGHNAQPIQPAKQFSIGTLNIKPFDVAHDACMPLGYLIQSTATGEKLVFATDTAYLRYTFDGATEIAVECNYSEELLNASELPKAVVDRIRRTHFALERVLEWLGKCGLERAKHIHLLHLSGDNSDAAFFCSAVRELTGIETSVANKAF